MEEVITIKRKEIATLAVGDIPLIYEILKQHKVADIIDKYVVRHKNWGGISPGNLLGFWLSYLLSTGDHRLSKFESWAEHHILLLSCLANSPEVLAVKDFADDRLEKLLDYLSEESTWRDIESAVNSNILSVYRFESVSELATIRIDAAPMQSYGRVKSSDSLLKYGYSKHHKKLPQFKVELSTLDNYVNHFAYPLCHLTSNGAKSDDKMYVPLINLTLKNLSGVKGYETGNLFVGDSKMSSQGIRGHVVHHKNYYLCPLSKVQLPVCQRLEAIKAAQKENYKQVQKTVKSATGETTSKVVAVGFERQVETKGFVEVAQKEVEWQERQLFVRSEAYAKKQEKSFEKKLMNTCEQLENLVVRKQGKKALTTYKEINQKAQEILKRQEMEDFLSFNIGKTIHQKKVRAYADKASRKEKTITFSLKISRNEQAIEAHKQLLAWQVYATNTPENKLPFESCVWKYRYQSNIERRFDDLRNEVMKLLPVYLQKDNRIEALVNILILGLKICSLIEYKAAKTLKDTGKQLAGLYDGNPRRKTKTPSMRRLLNAFEYITIGLIFTNKKLDYVLMTHIEPTQKKVLDVLDIKLEIYTQLVDKIQMFFSDA